MENYPAVCSSGTLRSAPDQAAVHFPHRWTEGGVELETTFSGAHLLHAAIAGCVLNDLYREAARLGIDLAGVRVSAGGAFDDVWVSTGVEYRVEVDSPADPARVEELLYAVDEVAEIPKALRAGAPVTRAA